MVLGFSCEGRMSNVSLIASTAAILVATALVLYRLVWAGSSVASMAGQGRLCRKAGDVGC
jgi:hypothetical protein